jgi:hypothetical protein
LGEQTENSILNRHLDEILYFFQCNSFDVIVFEDLDRFGSTEIFVKLREINSLINKSVDINRRVVFLYAIKDEVFEHKERTKFFDFIIPVIPTINSSNSYEKLRDRLPEEQYLNSTTNRGLSTNFLKEVSIYIDDMRLLHSIVNEMNLYFDVLASEHLHPTKLLALIIYKNIYPADFSLLHENKGLVYECSLSRNELVKYNTNDIRNKIDEIDLELDAIKTQKKQMQEMSKEDLKSIYLYKILEKLEHNATQISAHFNNEKIPFNTFMNDDVFNDLLTDNSITFVCLYNNNWRTIVLSFKEIEKEVNSKFTYLERKQLIIGLKTVKQENLENIKQTLISEGVKISKLKLYELLQKENKLTLFSNDKYSSDKSYDLIRYLLRNGYIDEYYHDHLSYFYNGRLSNNDMSFIKAIRDFRLSDFNLKLTYHNEIIKNRLREYDFKDIYIFNISLLDYLVENNSKHKRELNFLFNNIRINTEKSWSFLIEYVDTSSFVEVFIQLLSEEWPDFSLAIVDTHQLDSSQKNKFIETLLLYVSAESVANEMNRESKLSNYIAINPESILCLPPCDDHTVFPKLFALNIKFKYLERLNTDDKLIDYVFKHSLYEISPNNISLLLSLRGINQSKIEQKNLSSIYDVGDDTFTDYITVNIQSYIEEVFFKLPDNKNESSVAILNLLNSTLLNGDVKKEVINKQNHVFKSFESIPSELWLYLLEESKLEVTWSNLSEFYSKYPDHKTTLIDVLNKNAKILSQIKIPEEAQLADITDQIVEIILEDDGIDEIPFAQLIKSLPVTYISLTRYDLSKEKIKSLLDENILTLSQDNFKGLTKEHSELVGQFIFNNLLDYWPQSDEYPLSTETSVYLLDAIKSLTDQVALIQLLNEDDIKSDTRLIDSIANIFSKVTSLEKFEKSLLYIIIENATNALIVLPIFIKIINIFDKEEITALLESMGRSYSAIASYSSNPKLENNKLHRELASTLKSVDYISSHPIKDNKIVIYTKRS